MESVPEILLAELRESRDQGDADGVIKRFASDLVAHLWPEELRAAEQQIREYIDHPASSCLSAVEVALLTHAHMRILARLRYSTDADIGQSVGKFSAGLSKVIINYNRIRLENRLGILTLAIDLAIAAVILVALTDLLLWLMKAYL